MDNEYKDKARIKGDKELNVLNGNALSYFDSFVVFAKRVMAARLLI